MLHKDNNFNLNYREKVVFITKIAMALEYLHDNKVQHNHLSSCNVIVNDSMDPLLTDYGFKHVKETATIFLNYRNKNNYSAPEILKASKSTGNEETGVSLLKADIYSFGLLAWEILTGIEPFGVTQKKLNELVVDNDKRPSVEGIKQYAVTGLIQKCWEREQRKRPEVSEIVMLLKSL